MKAAESTRNSRSTAAQVGETDTISRIFCNLINNGESERYANALFHSPFHRQLDTDCAGKIVASRAFRVPDLREADHSRDIQWTRRTPGVLRVLRQEILRDLQPVQEGYCRRKLPFIIITVVDSFCAGPHGGGSSERVWNSWTYLDICPKRQRSSLKIDYATWRDSLEIFWKEIKDEKRRRSFLARSQIQKLHFVGSADEGVNRFLGFSH